MLGDEWRAETGVLLIQLANKIQEADPSNSKPKLKANKAQPGAPYC
jgi:hypothetical protein